MRQTSDQIRQAILHRDQSVRDAAVDYFAGSFSTDATIMPHVTQAVERYGVTKALDCYLPCRNLVQTKPTIRWILDRMRQDDTNQETRFAADGSRIIASADARLLARLQTEIADADVVDQRAREAISHRIDLLSTDTEETWERLLSFCDREVQGAVSESNADRAAAMVEAIGRDRPFAIERLMGVLRNPLDRHADMPARWLEILMIRLAGELRLEQDAPLIVDRLHEQSLEQAEAATTALIRIGTDAVVESLRVAYQDAQMGFRMATASILENIHTDLSAETCLTLLEQEDHAQVQASLCQAALMNFTTDAIEPARRFLREHPTLPDAAELLEDLTTSCNLLGLECDELSPERDQTHPDQPRRRS